MLSLREDDHRNVAVETPILRRGGGPLPMPRSSSSYAPQKRATSVNRQGDLRVTLGVNPPSESLWAPHSSSTPQTVELPGERTGSFNGGPTISFGALPDDQMLIAASEVELESGDEDSAALLPSRRVASSEPDPELTAMLSRAVKAVGLEWREPLCPEQSRLDDWYLGAAWAGSHPPTLMPFFPEVHEEVTILWKAPFFA